MTSTVTVGDISAAAGEGACVDSAASQFGHSVEQVVDAAEMVSVGAVGASTGGSPMAGTRAGRWASLADIVASLVAPELAVTGASNSELRRKQSEARSIDWLIASKLAIMALKSRWRSACHASR